MRGLRHILGVREQILAGARLSCSHTRFLCSTTSSANNANSNGSNDNGGENNARELDVYKKVNNLDFVTAAKILFSKPTKKVEFGLDFHLVQLFFALLPPLAVYLVAQYSRYRMRLMGEENMQRKLKAEEEKKAEKATEKALEKEEAASNPELLKVIDRLGALEETVKDIKSNLKPIEEAQEGISKSTSATATKPSYGSSSLPEPSLIEESEKKPVQATNATSETKTKEDQKSESKDCVSSVCQNNVITKW